MFTVIVQVRHQIQRSR